jgi:hypothetical protein
LWRLGATRLNKICWFADSVSFRSEGQSISGETYVKRERGPVPKTILHALRELEAEGKILIRDKKFVTYKMRLFVSLKDDPDTAHFSPVQLEIVSAISKEICTNHTAASISDMSHDQIWHCANEGEEIPLYATLASEQAELTDDIMNWADGVVQRIESGKAAA